MRIPWICCALLLAAPAAAWPAECDAVTLGAGVTLAEETALADLLAAPETFVGRELAVAGEVVAVCEMAGCWMDLAAPDGPAAEGGAGGGAGEDEGGGGPREALRVKVRDGEIVFPVWARGHAARAQGVVERLELTRDDYLRHREHEAHEGGAPFDPSTVAGEGPFAVYRLRGTGAVVCR